jgi:hypothetical protein
MGKFARANDHFYGSPTIHPVATVNATACFSQAPERRHTFRLPQLTLAMG